MVFDYFSNFTYTYQSKLETMNNIYSYPFNEK